MKNSAKFLRLLVFVSLSCLGGWTAYSQTSKTPFVPPPLDSIETNSEAKPRLLTDEEVGFVPDWARSPSSTNTPKPSGKNPFDQFDEPKTKSWERYDASAQYNLGLCYANGTGVAKDEEEAVKWYRKAADQNLAEAQYNLGYCYANGQGVAKDYVEAYKWVNLAAASKDEHTAKNVVKMRNWLESQMSPEQIAKAQRLSHGDLLDQVAAERQQNRSTTPKTLSLDEADQIVANSQQNRSTPVESKPRFDWGLVAAVSCATLAVLIAISVLIFQRKITTPKLLGLLVGSLLLFVGLIVFATNAENLPDATRLAIVVLAVTLLLTALAACVILAWRLKRRISTQKFILFCGVVLFVFCGLFPPWLYISDRGHTRSAGYSFILSAPPDARLDISRLAVEWLCIAVATGTVWLLVSKPEKKKDSKDN